MHLRLSARWQNPRPWQYLIRSWTSMYGPRRLVAPPMLSNSRTELSKELLSPLPATSSASQKQTSPASDSTNVKSWMWRRAEVLSTTVAPGTRKHRDSKLLASTWSSENTYTVTPPTSLMAVAGPLTSAPGATTSLHWWAGAEAPKTLLQTCKWLSADLTMQLTTLKLWDGDSMWCNLTTGGIKRRTTPLTSSGRVRPSLLSTMTEQSTLKQFLLFH